MTREKPAFFSALISAGSHKTAVAILSWWGHLAATPWLPDPWAQLFFPLPIPSSEPQLLFLERQILMNEPPPSGWRQGTRGWNQGNKERVKDWGKVSLGLKSSIRVSSSVLLILNGSRAQVWGRVEELQSKNIYDVWS